MRQHHSHGHPSRGAKHACCSGREMVMGCKPEEVPLVGEGRSRVFPGGRPPHDSDRTSTCLELSNIAGAPPARHHVGARGRHRRPRAADPNQTGGERRGVTRDVVVIHDLYR